MADASGAPSAGENVKKFGRGANECRICGRKQGLVRKYGIYFCRQCFREWAGKMGFKKMN
ncbi:MULTISPECIES: 30S ribosomal protein S14 [unclassified Methanoculleus]|uniref:30S ribosomal protein S14 n=1 Tax=unclassified Methanoculleus TaxID=2619537 RepID=UPI0025FF50A1|nr:MULTISPECIES: 30S ribosomal protein S14 [unclassified Methanoculleus]MCK9318606.1 30S ribosomal protein S14 [Methanoculleus sp.]MDD2254164.1 30S ribosomal protein S14 [Methanoculleus sp.]MDD2787061.1 30S ribosomal protein S14 [Methanoculleus sp.]MDD3216638.1 30S ribosomal protein S14 [Methanoculleus sp.]MDD4314737.1 30S ribosomal protein S14 [Methanoculleus sp.]